MLSHICWVCERDNRSVVATDWFMSGGNFVWSCKYHFENRG
jgi:hypothetical protein